MTLIQSPDSDSTLSKKERIALGIVLALAGVLTALDVFEDWVDGAPLEHIIPEVFIIFLSVGAGLYLVKNMLLRRKKAIDTVKQEVSIAKESAQSWRSRAESLKSGITDAISYQFDEWGLSNAEKEVSFLLLKGLSIQEISEVRETSERTVRQQASEVYKKSGLSGRAQLSAFFLEDLFDRSG